MKLFNEWFMNWSDEEKQDLIVRLRNVDGEFMDRFEKILNGETEENEDKTIPGLTSLPNLISNTDSGFDSSDYSKPNGDTNSSDSNNSPSDEQLAQKKENNHDQKENDHDREEEDEVTDEAVDQSVNDDADDESEGKEALTDE